MTSALIILTVTLALAFVILPILRYQSRQDAQAFDLAYRSFKLRTVQRHYRFLRAMAPWEIEKQYDLDLLFHSIR